MASKTKQDKIVAPKEYNSLEALEAEFNIPDVEPYTPKIAEDAEGRPVTITFRAPKDFGFEEMQMASEAEASGDVLAYFRIALSPEDMRKVQYYNLKAYQMGLLLAASQRYYDDAYGAVNAQGNFSGSDD